MLAWKLSWDCRFLWLALTCCSLILVFATWEITIQKILGLLIVAGFLFNDSRASPVRIRKSNIAINKLTLVTSTCLWSWSSLYVLLTERGHVSFLYLLYTTVIVLVILTCYRLIPNFLQNKKNPVLCYWQYSMLALIIALPYLSLKQMSFLVWSPWVVYIIINKLNYLTSDTRLHV